MLNPEPDEVPECDAKNPHRPRKTEITQIPNQVRALRAMLRSYEIPAKVAASNSRPVLSREAAKAAMTDSEKALAHVRAVMPPSHHHEAFFPNYRTRMLARGTFFGGRLVREMLMGGF